MPRFNNPHDALRHHVSGAIARGEGKAITEITPRTIADKWVSRLGLGWHIDTPAEDYTPPMPSGWRREYRKDMAALFAACADPYAEGVAAMDRWRAIHEINPKEQTL